MQTTRTILFAGGGTGGHIFPNLAIAQRLRHLDDQNRYEPHFLISTRSLDAQLMRKHQLAYTVLSVQPLTKNPLRLPGWYLAWRRSLRRMRLLIRDRRAAAVVATGGFVSGPAIVAAARSRRPVPTVLVNLDAHVGKASRRLAPLAAKIFSAYPVADLPGAQLVGVPLRDLARAKLPPDVAREKLGLIPDRPVLLVCGGSQGAQSVNHLMTRLMYQPQVTSALTHWQVLHLTGQRDTVGPKLAYEQAGVSAQVQTFCDEMGLAWSAAELAISRAGASSVAEAWAAACPTIFLPYPYHADEHQKLNAQPMADTGGAIIVKDLIDPAANAQALEPILLTLLRDPGKRKVASQRLRESRPPDGADAVARWLIERLEGARPA